MYTWPNKSVYELIFEANETCDICEQHFKKLEDMIQFGEWFVHKDCARNYDAQKVYSEQEK